MSGEPLILARFFDALEVEAERDDDDERAGELARTLATLIVRRLRALGAERLSVLLAVVDVLSLDRGTVRLLQAMAGLVDDDTRARVADTVMDSIDAELETRRKAVALRERTTGAGVSERLHAAVGRLEPTAALHLVEFAEAVAGGRWEAAVTRATLTLDEAKRP